MSRVTKVAAIVLGFLVVLLAGVWFRLRGPDIPYEALEARHAQAGSQFVDLPGGFHVHYLDSGAGDARGADSSPGDSSIGDASLAHSSAGAAPSGAARAVGSGADAEADRAARPVLVLLHGFGDSYTSWEGWTRELRSRYRVISLDFPGHGLTRSPEGYVLSGDGLVDFVDVFAQTLGLPKFALAGNSLGGAVAWQLALRHPQRIDALILVDAAGWPNETPPGEAPLAFKILRYRLGRALLRNIDNRPLIDQGLKIDVFDPSLITPALVDRWAEFQRAPGHRAILMSADLGALRRATAVELSRIAVPTLVLNGANDVLVEPASARKFAAAIPGAKLIVYPQVGHLPQIEIPARSAADVAEFLASALPGGAEPPH